jgi:hypothetical protein
MRFFALYFPVCSSTLFNTFRSISRLAFAIELTLSTSSAIISNQTGRSQERASLRTFMFDSISSQESRERLGRKQSDFWLRLASCTNVDHHREREAFFPSVFILGLYSSWVKTVVVRWMDFIYLLVLPKRVRHTIDTAIPTERALHSIYTLLSLSLRCIRSILALHRNSGTRPYFLAGWPWLGKSHLSKAVMQNIQHVSPH